MRLFARFLVILIVLSASQRAFAQTPPSEYQRAVNHARHKRTVGMTLTFVGMGISTLGAALFTAGVRTAGEASGPWVGLYAGGMIMMPLGVVVDAVGIPLWATARVKF